MAQSFGQLLCREECRVFSETLRTACRRRRFVERSRQKESRLKALVQYLLSRTKAPATCVASLASFQFHICQTAWRKLSRSHQRLKYLCRARGVFSLCRVVPRACKNYNTCPP